MLSQQLCLRSVSKPDTQAIHQLENSLYINPWSTGSIQKELEAPGSFSICASEKKSGIIGYGFFRSVADEWHIMRIGVSPLFQRQKIGLQLMISSEKIAVDMGLQTAYLEVAKSNKAAMRLYLKTGFKVVGTRPGYYGHDDALNMKKNITDEVAFPAARTSS